MGTPKSSISMAFSIIYYPFGGPAIYGNPHMSTICMCLHKYIVELVGAPRLFPFLLLPTLHQGPPEPLKAPRLLWLQPRTVVTYGPTLSPRCFT